MKNKTVLQWLQELGSKEGKYTGGSAASSVAAISASLAQFIFELQAGKKSYVNQEDMIQAGIKKAISLQEDFLDLVEVDAKAFEPVLPLYRLPQNTEEEKKIREQKINEGLADAANPPYEMLLKLDEVVRLYEQLSELNLAGSLVIDIIIGLDIAIAGLKSSKNSSMINITSITNPEMEKVLTKKVISQYEKTLEKAEGLKESVQQTMD